jgi:2-polyprenyl-3-methyl-5-hydroxy-6-metoxy-1,4-benzoquinol methylase
MDKWSLYKKLERRIVPGLLHSQRVYKEQLKKYARPGCVWLDAGCGRGIFPEWMRAEDRAVTPAGALVIGMDMDVPSLRDNSSVSYCVAGNLEQAPFRPRLFDLITANMVVEHVAEPAEALQHVSKLLKPGGLFIFHTPNYLNYQTILVSLLPQGIKNAMAKRLEERDEEDVFPTHYRMNTASAIGRLARENGLEVRDLILVNSTAETVALGPFVAIELILIRILNWKIFRNYRSNIIAVLRRAPG